MPHSVNSRTASPAELQTLDRRVQMRFLRTDQAAAYLGLSGRTLEKHRTYGTGPVYRKLGNRVVYTIEELDAWAEIGTRRSTSDPGKGVVHPAKPIPGISRSKPAVKR
ncbi:helix-turn-helix transcriptional regulator [Brevundimonas naejangsanensis]|uniref:helix-turn-helix transcriptional regulator n=1 Tax=Brevundimonas naejangsanensis TaxID=588932 RepID=UPI003D16DBB4